MEFKSVSKNCVKEWYILRTVLFVLLTGSFVGMLFVPTEDKSDKVAQICILIVLGMMVVWAAVFAFVFPKMQYNRLKYRIYEDRIEKKSGVIFLRSAFVPFVRIQHVEVFRGILDRVFKMSSVYIFTACGAVRLQNLDIDQAEDVVTHVRSLLAQEGGKND